MISYEATLDMSQSSLKPSNYGKILPFRTAGLPPCFSQDLPAVESIFRAASEPDFNEHDWLIFS
jgi:hypothetical protein